MGLGRGKKAVTPVPGQLVQKGSEQQVIISTFVSALAEPDKTEVKRREACVDFIFLNVK